MIEADDDDPPVPKGTVLVARPNGAALRQYLIAQGLLVSRDERKPRDIAGPCLRLEPDVRTAAEAMAHRAAR